MTDTTRASRSIAIAATFTAEPLGDTLSFWSRELRLDAPVAFAPYAQVFQELLDPGSLLAGNIGGLNVVLVRLDDWEPSEPRATGGPLSALASGDGGMTLERNVDELGRAIEAFVERARSPLVVCLTPVSASDPGRLARFTALERGLAESLRSLRGVEVIPSGDILAAYEVAEYHDPRSDALGHVPYTPEGFAALATVIARRAHGLLSPPRKVIVLDCDGTLWRGVCGEDGPLGVEVDAPRAALQELMVAQHEAGRLLCLCSKNAEADVLEVFDRHPGMRLGRQHLVSWRIDWGPKSANLRSLAEELSLGLDSFVFIDDDPVQCAEVEAGCPEVLTILLPPAAEIPRFLDHVWALDRRALTAEDRKRTGLYREEKARGRLRESAATFEAFLEGLNLRVSIQPMAPAHVGRVSQLTQRTNQFNTTTIRRSESEIQRLDAAGLECLVVHVTDRFGDYGLVGVVVFGAAGGRLTVDSFLMSCRALGRGVEHQVIAYLAGIAEARGCAGLDLPLTPTPRNQPALQFLEQIGAPHRRAEGAGFRFSLPLDVARSARPVAGGALPAEGEGEPPAAPPPGSGRRPGGRTALLGVHDIGRILGAVEAAHGMRATGPAVPASPLRDWLGILWARALGVARVDAGADLFARADVSTAAAEIAQRLRDVLEVDIAVDAMRAAPTVTGLARALAERAPGRDLDAVAVVAAAIDALSDEEVTSRLSERQGRSHVRYRCLGLERGAALGGSELLLSRATGARWRGSAAVADLAERCREFKTIAEHAGDLAGATRGHIGVVADRLAEAARAGLLISDEALAERCLRALPERAPVAGPPITAVGLITCDRVDALARSLASYVENCMTHGRAPEFVVADDSRDAGTRAQYRDRLAALKARHGARISYIGEEERQAVVRALVDKGGIPEPVARFALLDPDRLGTTIGANTNALYLHAVGEAFFEADDDTVCRPIAHPGAPAARRDGAALAGGVDPCDYWFFESRAALSAQVAPVSRDLLGMHEGLLGRAAADIVREHGVDGLNVASADAALLERLERGGATVRATFNGLAGDCGWGAPFGYWGAPLGYLLMSGASHDRLVASEAAYRATSASRDILRVVGRPTIADATFGMSTFMGVDNRGLLPPHFPVGRGSDLIFARTVWTCVPDSLIGHVPWALWHEPVEPRRFWPGEMFRTASAFDVTKLLMVCLQGWDGGHGRGDERGRQQSLGRYLREIGGLAPGDFRQVVARGALAATTALAAEAEAALAARGGAPAFWADDVRRYLDLALDSLTRDEALVPLDLLAGRTPAEAIEVGRRQVAAFGELFCWWPEMMDLARRWRDEGRRIGVEI